MPRFPRPKAADLIAIALSLLATAGTAWAAMSRAGGSEPGFIVSAGGKTFAYRLDEDATLSFSGPIGETVGSVREGEVRVASSPCEEQSCVASGAMSRAGQWTACLPNKVMVRVTGGASETDAATY